MINFYVVFVNTLLVNILTIKIRVVQINGM